MSLREAAEAILKSVEGEMSSAYNRAHAVCCGRGIDECCGSPEPEWDEADQLVMNTLASIQNALRAALAEAEAPKAEPVAWALAYREDPDDYDHFTTVASTMKRWVEDEDNIAVPLYTHPPKAEAVVNQQMTTEPVELSDEEILALWQPPLEGAVQRPILGKNKILAFARAVLAHGRKR